MTVETVETERLAVEVPLRLLPLLDHAASQSPLVAAALLGLYEAMGLSGEYELRVSGARLIPKAVVPPN